MYKLVLEYRDASNWKTGLEWEVDEASHPNVVHLKTGDEITMGEYGTPTQSRFFDSEFHPYPYNHNEDHNLLDVLSVQRVTDRHEEGKTS